MRFYTSQSTKQTVHIEKLFLQFRDIWERWNFIFFLSNYCYILFNINFGSNFVNSENRGWTVHMFQVYIFPTLCPTCPVREILFSNVFPSVYSGCGENNMAASQGRLVGFRGLHSTRCLRTTNKQTVQSAISKGIGAKECRRTFFTSILRQGKALQKH